MDDDDDTTSRLLRLVREDAEQQPRVSVPAWRVALARAHVAWAKARHIRTPEQRYDPKGWDEWE